MAKRVFGLLIVIAALLSSVAHGQTSGAKAKDPALQAAIDGRKKAIDTRNPSDWSKYTSDDFVNVSAEGAIRSRETRLKDLSVPSTAPQSKVIIDSVRTFGPDTAVSIQHNSPNNSRITIVWMRQGGTWRAVSSHTSVVTGK
jgi:hemin uptake protein HemP